MISPKIPIPEDDTAPGIIGAFRVADDEYRVQIDVSNSNIAYFRIICETQQRPDITIQLYHPEYYNGSIKLTKFEKVELLKFLNDKCSFNTKFTNYEMLRDIWDGMNNDYSTYPEEDYYWELNMPDYNLLEEIVWII
jgi:hypothetical protein